MVYGATMPWILRACVLVSNRATSSEQSVLKESRLQISNSIIGGAAVYTAILLFPTIVWGQRRRQDTEWLLLQTVLMLVGLWVFVQYTHAERTVALQMILAQLFRTLSTAARNRQYSLEYAPGVYWLSGMAALSLPIATAMVLPSSEAVDLWLLGALFAGEAMGAVVMLVATAIAVFGDAYERMWGAFEDGYF